MSRVVAPGPSARRTPSARAIVHDDQPRASVRRNLPDHDSLDRLRRQDPLLADAMDRTPPFPGFPDHARRGSHFHALARAIVYQQLAGNAAASIYDRVRALTPGTRFPDPKECLTLSDQAFRKAGLSRNKTRALKDLAERVTSGEVSLRSIDRASDDDVITQLTRVWGIGEWSAQIFLMFRLGRLDVMPATDLGIREGLKRLDGLDGRPPPSAVLERAEVWRPLRSVAAWVLWRLLDAES